MSAVIEIEAPMEQEREFGREALIRRLGQLAKQRREELGLGRVPFAKAAGLGSDKTMQDFEFGRRLAHGTSLRKIERALGWRQGVVDDIMRNVDRKASSIQLEDLDEFEPGEALPLDRISTADLLSEVIRRLTVIKGAIGTPQPSIQDVIGVAAPHKDLFDLAASTNVEHLEGEEPEND
jgi:hypothetical protein